MTRTIEREYRFSQREVREAILLMLKKQDIQAPAYIGDTDTCSWTDEPDGGVTVKWRVEDDIDVPA